jgi:LysR family glycine cleavage system transcriptional activator
MGHIPSTQSLRAFESAVRHQSYSRAARELGVTHGAISQRIRELEARQGACLFRRAGRGMMPTELALQVVTQVRSALSLLDRAFVLRKRPTRTVRLSVLPSFASHWLLPRLAEFHARYRDIEIEIDATTQLMGPDDDVDVAIRYGPGSWPGVQARRLCTEHLSVVCAPAYRDAQGICVPADLRSTMMIRNPWQPWTPWLRAASLPNLEPAGPVYLDSGLVVQAAVLGHGVALARGLLMHDALALGTLVQLFDLEVEDVYGWYAVNLRPANADTQAFENWLASACLSSNTRTVASSASCAEAKSHGAVR